MDLTGTPVDPLSGKLSAKQTERFFPGERSKVKPINRTIYMKLLNEILGTKYPIIQGGMAPPASLPPPAPTPVRWVLSAQAA